MAVAVLPVVGLILASGRCASAARRAVDVAIPLRLPLRWIERAVKEQLFNGPEGTCTFVADETICRFYLSRPKLDARRKMLRLTCEADVLYVGAGEAACVDPRREKPARWSGGFERRCHPASGSARPCRDRR